MNNILREFRFFCRAYIDDVVIFFKTLEDHSRHLHSVFAKFQIRSISLKLSKVFINYLSITLLSQQVNELKLIADDDKMRVLQEIQFLTTLSALEKYLSLIDWLRNFISYYA